MKHYETLVGLLVRLGLARTTRDAFIKISDGKVMVNGKQAKHTRTLLEEKPEYIVCGMNEVRNIEWPTL